MLLLVNIRLVGNIIYADVLPEKDESRKFSLAVDIRTEKIVEVSVSERNMYVRQAVAKLLKTSWEYGKNIPDTVLSMWY